jgi:ferredoxin
MADKSIRLADNPAGKWYVDETCTPCHVCLDEAGPSTATPLLRYNADETKVYFVKQPENPDEEAAAQRALEICPTQAIGSDGE